MNPPPRSKPIDYKEFVETHGNVIPNDWPVEVRAGKIVIAKQHEGQTLRAAIADNLFEGNWAQRRFNHVMDRIRPNKSVTETIDALDAVVAQANRECTKIMGVRKDFNGPTVLLSEPESDKPFWQHLQHKILNLQLEQAGATVKSPQANTAIMVRSAEIAFMSAENNPTLKMLQQEFKDSKLTFKQNNALIESGNVLQHTQSNTLFVGVKTNSDGTLNVNEVNEAKELAKTLDMKLKTIPRVCGDKYHLSTMMSILPDGSIMVLPETTNQRGMEAIYTAADKKDVLEVKQGPDSQSTGLHMITVNRHVFTPKLYPEMDKFLRARGFYPHEGFYEALDTGPHTQVDIVKQGKKESPLKGLEMDTLPKLAWSGAEPGQDRTQPVLVVHNKTASNPSLG